MQPTKKAAGSKQKTQSLTVKQWFDQALALPPTTGEPYVQQALPDHYIQQQVSFSNENIDASVWDRKVDVKTEPEQSKNSKKKGADDEIAWHYRKQPNRKYSEPEDTLTVEIELESGSKKKHVLAVGGLYLGSCSAVTSDIWAQVDTETTHTLVLLGNVFDTMCIDAFHQAPSDITKIEELISSQSEGVLSSLRKLAEEIKIYYMLGSTDSELTRVAIERLLGDKIIFVPQNHLILSLKLGTEPYRLLFTSGRQWDFLNHTDLPADQLLVGKPISFYLARASTANPNFSVTSLIRPIASSLPDQLTKDFLQQISKRPLQDKLTERMLMSALQIGNPEKMVEIKCLVDQGKYITLQTILEYPYIKYLMAKVCFDKVCYFQDKRQLGHFWSCMSNAWTSILMDWIK